MLFITGYVGSRTFHFIPEMAYLHRWGWGMHEYRLYCLDGAGQISRVADVVRAANDEEAIAAARRDHAGVACELWLGRRLVARVDIAGNVQLVD